MVTKGKNNAGNNKLLLIIVPIVILVGLAIFNSGGKTTNQTQLAETVEQNTGAQNTLSPPSQPVKETSDQNRQNILAENVRSHNNKGEQNSAPTIKLTEPDENEIINTNPFTIWWKSDDPNGDTLLITLE